MIHYSFWLPFCCARGYYTVLFSVFQIGSHGSHSPVVPRGSRNVRDVDGEGDGDVTFSICVKVLFRIVAVSGTVCICSVIIKGDAW